MNVILKKPYAFLVKHFKLIHILLTLVLAYLVYRSNLILSFMNQYISSNQTSVVDDITNTIFNIWMFVFPFAIIVLSLIIISLMSVKKKPIFLYIFNIALAIAILVFYNLSFSLMTEMESVILEARSVRLFRDFVTILELFQCASLITMLIRATGFDIKKFNFGQDLQELEINDTDNEEFEVNVEVDANEVHRKINRFRRVIKYVYYEHRFLIDVGILIGISAVCFMIYMNIGIYERDVKQNTIFSTTSFNLGITNSYITNKDYKGVTIDKENMLVVLEMSIKSKGASKVLDRAMVNLEIKDQHFYHIETYKDDVMDLGHTYQDSKISTSFEKQLLVFKIPKALQNEKMIFTYTDKIDYISNGINSKYIKVEIKPTKIDQNKKEINETIGNDLSFEKSIFKKTKLNIASAEMKQEFRENYQFCVTKEECYTSAEFVMPNYNSNQDKAILKLQGTLQLDEEIVLSRVYTLYNFISYFAKLKYEINGEVLTSKVTLSQVRPSKFELSDTYYIEIPKETIDASKVWLDFHVRNKEYLYQIK